MFVYSQKQMALILYLVLAFLCTNRANGATHWVVTEDGRIQSQDSMFNLQRPYDLMAMLRQEDRARALEDLKQELLLRKESIDRNEDRDTGLEQRIYKMDPDCIAAGKPLPEYDLYISTVLPLENKGIRPEEHIDFRAHSVPLPIPPVCTEMTELDFSIEAFEHLEGVKHRENLTGTPELGLKNAITHRENVDDYGHLVYEALRKNKTSWVLYNMAAFYWRIKGHPYNVVECIRRALHYSPRSYRDVALISLANVLHRAHYSQEAAVVVNAALEVSKDLNVNHFTLGNIYAVLGEYNKSVNSFDETLLIQPDFEAAELCRHAVICHAKVEEALENQHRSLQQTLTDLKEYQERHERWQRLQERAQAEQAPSDVKFDQRVGYESYKIRRMSQGVGEYCRMEDRDGRQHLQCSWARKAQSDQQILGAWNQPPAREHQPKPDPNPDIPVALVYHEPIRTAKFTSRRVLSDEEEAELQHKDADWPSKEECDTFVRKFPAWNEFPTTYLPAENKGFEVKLLLSEAQDLKEGVQHSLPWYPPRCNLATIPEGDKVLDFVQSVQDRGKLPQKVLDSSMRTVLLDLVEGDVTEEEIGQRILTALKKEVGPQWLLYNLAGLYWRVKGGSEQGIDCLRQALYYVPTVYKDVPLVNLANLLYKLEKVDDALTVMKEAIGVNDLEPETHYFLGNLLAAKGNITGATYHYEQALQQDPEHVAAFSSLRSLKCYYKFHRTAQSAAPIPKDPSPGQSCSQSCTATCSNNKGRASKGQIESRLICKNENGRESCVVETSTPNCDHGPCTQTCSISPLSIETCETPNGVKCLGHNANLEDLPIDGSVPKCQGNMDNCRQPSSLTPLSDTLGPNPTADPDFFDKMEAVKEYYRHRGLCAGDDCQKYLVQDFEDLSNLLSQLHAQECSHGNRMDENMCNNNAEQNSPPPSKKDNKKPANSEKKETGVHGNRENNGNHDDDTDEDQYYEDEEVIYDDEESELVDFNWEEEATTETETTEKPTVTEARTPVTEATKPPATKQLQENIMEWADDELSIHSPDPMRHISEVTSIPWPTWEQCRLDYPDLDFQVFSSTWVSITTKNVNMADLIDLKTPVTGVLQKPTCSHATHIPHTPLDALPSIQTIQTLPYEAEWSLREILMKLGDDVESLGVVGTRISRAMQKKPMSWALANLAALYWRVEGDASKAFDCIKVAYQMAPPDAQDIALLSLVNILHQVGALEEALVVCDMALEADPKLVATHFTMANIYAAREEWGRARKFFESTLGLQASFHPAVERLYSLRCQKILSNPHIYRSLTGHSGRTEL